MIRPLATYAFFLACSVALSSLADEAPSSHLEPRSGLVFMYLPGGTFLYGREPTDSVRTADETSGLTQTVHAFYMGQTETTVGAYETCVGAGACTQPGNALGCNSGRAHSDHPVTCVDWEQADQFCRWIGGRLPTSIEWEYAAKGGEHRPYPWGDELPTDELAHRGGDVAVGSRPKGASKHGLLDMAGSVAEWTSSTLDGLKEVRGVWWNMGRGISAPSVLMRNSMRYRAPADTRQPRFGFRCVLPE